MTVELTNFRITRFEFPRERRIGDSQLSIPDTNWVGAVELFDASGRSGLGFFASLLAPLPSLRDLTGLFDDKLWPSLYGRVPEALLNGMRPRCATGSEVPLWDLNEAIETALWDLVSKRAGLPLFQLLGGSQAERAAYASGLCFHLSDSQAYEFYTQASRSGYRAYKLKVGHPMLSWDLHRLELVRTAVGADALLMVDANEAWSLEEATDRIRAYGEAGFAVHWVEDPISRNDFAGLRKLRQAIGPVRVNAGEYLSGDERVALIAAQAVDVMNLNGGFTEGLRVARECVSPRIPTSVGNTLMNVGAHLSAVLAYPEMVEDSRLNWNDILVRPLPVIDGNYVLPMEPGHGLALAADAVREWATL